MLCSHGNRYFSSTCRTEGHAVWNRWVISAKGKFQCTQVWLLQRGNSIKFQCTQVWLLQRGNSIKFQCTQVWLLQRGNSIKFQHTQTWLPEHSCCPLHQPTWKHGHVRSRHHSGKHLPPPLHPPQPPIPTPPTHLRTWSWSGPGTIEWKTALTHTLMRNLFVPNNHPHQLSTTPHPRSTNPPENMGMVRSVCSAASCSDRLIWALQ